MKYSFTNVPHRRTFKLGHIFEDFGCLSTNAMCGKNMAFYTIKREVTSNSLIPVKCSQRCSCADARHSEINGHCTGILSDMNIRSTTSQVNIFKNVKRVSRKFPLVTISIFAIYGANYEGKFHQIG